MRAREALEGGRPVYRLKAKEIEDFRRRNWGLNFNGTGAFFSQNPETGNIAIMTDIQGLEDFFGDMDFKVAGTRKGITAIQMDIKIKGIDKEILTRALAQAREGRLFIMDKMVAVLAEPRTEMSKFAPRIMQFMIDPDKIREVIGSGGKVINKIIAETGVKIDLEDDGRVFITSPDLEAADRAKAQIDAIVKEIQVGDVYLGKVTRTLDIGAVVELAPGKDGLVHISKLANEHVDKVEDVVKVGDEILVRVVEIDKLKGRVRLTRKGPAAGRQKGRWQRRTAAGAPS